MTDQPEGDDQEPDRNDASPGEGTAAAAKAPRGRRRRLLRDIAEENLEGTARLMVARDALVRAVFDGPRVRDDGTDKFVDGETFVDSVGRLIRLLASLTESRPQIFAFGFGHSVYVDIGSPPEELERADHAYGLYQEAEAESDKQHLAPSAIPQTTLAVLAAANLLEESEEDVVTAALAYGTGVTDAYKSLVRLLAEEDLSVRLEVGPTPETADEEPVEITSLSHETAAVYKEELMAVGSEETITITATGILTMADSRRRLVRLDLDKSARRDPAIARNTRTISARYTVGAERAIKAGNLWDQNVIATFQMTRARRGTTAHLRKPIYMLTAARLRYGGHDAEAEAKTLEEIEDEVAEASADLDAEADA